MSAFAYTTTIIIAFIAISIFSLADYYYHSHNLFLELVPVSAEPVPDGNGVIMYNYPKIDAIVYNPLILSSGGLTYYTEYENSGDNKSKEYFINTANWLVENAKHKEGGKYSIWEFDFTWPWYGGVKPPYYSAYAQAIGMVVLAHAYDLTDNEIYLDEAHRAFQSLLVNYDDGGVMTTEEEDGNSIFLHILAKPGFQKAYVLNGHTGSLLHIWQYYELTKNSQAKSLFDKGINYLKHNLWKYDNRGWSFYDQSYRPSHISYHKIHIEHLQTLYNIIGEPILKEYSNKFNKYLPKNVNSTP